MDKLYLKGIEIFANHGVFPEEKQLGQKFILDIEIKLNTREAAVNNDLSKSINYGELCHNVEKEFTKCKYDLIETAAEIIAEYILYNYDLAQRVKIKLKKPWAPIARHLQYAAIEIERGWHKAYISFGSNMENKKENIEVALKKIKEFPEIKIKKISTLVETEPWGNVYQDNFVNGVMEIKTILSPLELMEKLLSIESQMKRKRIIKWGPRIIDLDIILYDNVISDDERIILPHPRMEDRLFVLEPLNEIAPYTMHPILNKPVFRILEDLKSKLNKSN